MFKEFATDDSNASFEQCRVVLVVCRFSDHKCRHGNVYAARCNASFIMGFIVFVSSRRDTASQYGKGRNISVTYLANHNTLDSWPIRARLASQNNELCKNRHVSERWSIEEQQ